MSLSAELPPEGEDRGEPTPGQGLAVAAESLYLANLLALPGLAFLVLVWLDWRARARSETPVLALAHLGQTVRASLWAGALLVAVNAAIVALGGWRGIHTWVILILYFTVCHSSLVLMGVLGLARAMAGQCWRYPLIGRPLPAGCPRGGRP